MYWAPYAIGSPIDSSVYTALTEECGDTTGNFLGENGFQHYRERRIVVSPMNGELPGWLGSNVYSNYVPSDAFRHASGWSDPPELSTSSMVPAVLAAANPSRPYIDSAVFLGELRDFPGMARDLVHSALNVFKGSRALAKHPDGKSIALRRAAKELYNTDNQFLATTFGWLPFISDLQKYTSVVKATRDRTSELQHLLSQGSTSKTLSLADNTVRFNEQSTIGALFFASPKAIVTTSIRRRYWGTGRYHLDINGALATTPTDDKIAKLAKQASYGNTLDLQTVWNLTPWSWLIDWASNTGDFIASRRNIVGATASTACIMHYLGRFSRVECTEKPKINGGSFDFIQERKQREVYPGLTLPEVTVPFLTGKQQSILAALTTTRLKPRM